ncbi:hypothetical protein [Erythrobacter sp. MTPC3]|uniref:hypothetical protein n=1 Tax=Erythrobacter sp. MTPC3 TaxID=3056564 RepID=UPI0036F3AC02
MPKTTHLPRSRYPVRPGDDESRRAHFQHWERCVVQPAIEARKGGIAQTTPEQLARHAHNERVVLGRG